MIDVEKYLKHAIFDTRQQEQLIQVLTAIQQDAAANLAAAITALLEDGVQLTDSDGNEVATEVRNSRLLLGVMAPKLEDLLTQILVELKKRKDDGD